jgi:D-3-phosphoglycerate dehydrogenase
VSLNCPLTKDNYHLLDGTTLATMKPGAWIINTARGALIEESALVAALRSGQIGAASLDVFEVEPLPPDSPLRGMEHVILGAHNSSNTAEAVLRTSIQAIDNLLGGLGASDDRVA